jgi:sigma-70-like protein
MPPRSRATGFERLAPDQRAAVELVLRQGRSYGELSDLLGMPEETIRARARAGLAALAPDLPAPARSAEIADWLLGQQSERHAARTRELLLSDPDAQRWAATVAKPLREVPGGESVPALPTGTELPEPRVNGKTTRPRASRAREPVAEPGRSSRLGGAILIGAAVLLVGAVLAFVLLRGGDDTEEPPAASTAAPTATATATAVGANDIILKGPAGSKALGVMRLFQANDGTVRFALAGTGVPANKSGETYSLWFQKKDGAARLLGDVKDPVSDSGELTSAGPGNADVEQFPQWFATYDSVLVTQDDKGAKKPGKVVLSGALPHSQSR